MEPARKADTSNAAHYRRHRPEDTLLYQLVARYYPEFAELLARHDCMDAGGRATQGAVAEGTPLPAYVAREFEAYLECGPPAYHDRPLGTVIAGLRCHLRR